MTCGLLAINNFCVSSLNPTFLWVWISTLEILLVFLVDYWVLVTVFFLSIGGEHWWTNLSILCLYVLVHGYHVKKIIFHIILSFLSGCRRSTTNSSFLNIFKTWIVVSSDHVLMHYRMKGSCKSGHSLERVSEGE